MAKQSIVAAVKGGRILVSDGAWGTFLQKKGMQAGECPEFWNIEHAADVADIGDVAQGYRAVAEQCRGDEWQGLVLVAGYLHRSGDRADHQSRVNAIIYADQ